MVNIEDSQSFATSVVIPCFNRETLIGEAIESALTQTGATVDVIVIDDGSTDNSWKVLESFGQRITARKTENKGVASARNYGVQLASGSWIKFLDSDDVLLPGAISLQLKQALATPERTIPVGQLSDDPSDRSELSSPSSKGSDLSPFDLSSSALQVSQPLFEKSVFQKIGGFQRSSIAEDYELVLRIAFEGWKFRCFPEPVVFFRDHDDPARLSKSITDERFVEVTRVYERLLHELTNRDHTGAPEYFRGIASNAWSMGRRAVRNGQIDRAYRLFQIAQQAGGRTASKARFPMSLLYYVLDPVRAELLSESFKRLTGPGSK